MEEHLEESASWTQLLAAIRERDLETAELGYVERGEIVDVQDPVDVEAVQVDVIEMSPGVLVCSSESTADEPLADEPLADIPLADVSTSIGDTTPETEVPHGNTDERYGFVAVE